jgi:3'-phosphoadenosine 5'-phosphosulfate sulfotransferase (PAPS reductase)/FAD synthetase
MSRTPSRARSTALHLGSTIVPSDTQPRQTDLFRTPRVPVLVAWGAGVDSTSMLIELVESGNPPDAVLFADTGGEHPVTYRFIPIFMA